MIDHPVREDGALSETVSTLWKSKSHTVPAGNTLSNVMVLVTYRGPLAHAAVLPATGVSSPSTVPTVNTAPVMTDRLGNTHTHSGWMETVCGRCGDGMEMYSRPLIVT